MVSSSTALYLCQWRLFEAQFLIGCQTLSTSCKKSIFNHGGGGGGVSGFNQSRRLLSVTLKEQNPNLVPPKCFVSDGAGASGESVQDEDKQLQVFPFLSFPLLSLSLSAHSLCRSAHSRVLVI